MSFRSVFLTSLACVPLLSGMLATPVHAQNGTWNTTTNGTWTTDTNWVGNIIADGADNNANFTFNITNDLNVTLGADRTIGNITFTDSTTSSNNMTISGANVLTLDRTSGAPIVDVTQSGRTLTISSVIAGADGLQKDGAGTLVISAFPTYTGATIITGGTFNVSGLSAASTPISPLTTSSIAFTTANSTFIAASFNTALVSYPTMSIASGVTATFVKGTGGNNTPYAIPSLTGGGTFSYTNPGNSGTGTSVTFTTLAGFTGNLQINMSNSNGGGSINTPDLNDAVGSKILMNAGSAGTATAFNFTGSSNLTLVNRQFELNGTFANGLHVINNNGTSSSNFTINSNLAVTGANAKVLRLGGSNAGGTSTFAGNIVDGSGIISLIKADASTWVLSGTNTYTGGTTVTGGILRISNAAAFPSIGNLTVTGGTIESTVGTITAARYLATAGTFTAPLGGSGDFYKSGTGTSNLNGANSYSGGTVVAGGNLAIGASGTLGANTIGNSITVANDGVLRLSAAANSGANQGISLASSSNTGAPVLSGGAGPVGRLAVLGLGFNGLPNGAISQANTLGGVIAINAVTGYNTDLSSVLTGKNLFLGAIGTSTFTGAAGTVVAGNDSLYRLGGGGGTLTFNTTNLFTGASGVQVGSTFANGGGTVVSSAAQDYTGATTVNAGTLTLSGANGTATSSSGFTLNGGRLFLDSGASNNANRIGNVNVSLRNGGELSLNGNAAGTTEAFGDLGIGSGYSTVTATATTTASTLAGTGFARTNNGTALFRGTALGQNVAAMGQVTLSDTSGLSFVGASTLNNAASGDTTKDVKIVPYLIGATTGTGTGDTFVTYDDTLGFRVLNTTNQFNTTVTTGNNVRFTSAQTGIATNSINSLIIAHTGSSTIADGATLTVASGAVLFSSAGTIAPVGSGTGILDFGAAEGIVTTVANGVISARITGSGGLTKSGTGQLTLSNTNNSYTGGTVLNGGVLATSVDGNLGGSGGITVNANTTWSMGGSAVTYARALTINEGATLQLNSGNAGKTVSGVLSGNGTLYANHSTDFIFSNAANTFTGAIVSQTANSTTYGLGFASIGDTAGAGLINLIGNSGTFRWLSASGSTTTLVNRQFAISTPGQGTISALGTTAASDLVINQDLLISGEAGARSLRLAGANTGNNTFAGQIADNGPSVVSLNKADAGKWILSNANTFSGTTLVSGGILELTNSLALQNSPLDATSSVNGAAAAGLRTTVTTLTIGGLNGTKNLSTLFTTTSGGYGGVTALTLNPGEGVTASYSGVIANGAAGMTLTKTGAGTQILTGANTYTGATTVTAGSLIVNGTLASSSLVVNGSLGGSGVLANATLSGSGSIDPGNSPGIMTALATDPTGGLAYNFEFTAANVDPTWNAPMASVNDVLRLTDATPFTANLDASNVVSVYLDVASITAGDVFTGGFYTDNNLDFLASIEDATFAFYLADPSGSVNYNGLDYDLYTGPNTFTVSTVAKTADFGSGPISGYSTQFLVVPEPATLALLGAGLGLLGLHVARRRKA
jgi:autotransporter-associated beta strand protein